MMLSIEKKRLYEMLNEFYLLGKNDGTLKDCKQKLKSIYIDNLTGEVL